METKSNTVDNKTDARHSTEIEKILTNSPSWILRWGLSWLFILLVVLAGLSKLIKYPIYLVTPITFHAANTTSPLAAMGNNRFFGEIVLSRGDFSKIVNGQLVIIKIEKGMNDYDTTNGQIILEKQRQNLQNKYVVNIKLSPFAFHNGQIQIERMAFAQIRIQNESLLDRMTEGVFRLNK